MKISLPGKTFRPLSIGAAIYLILFSLTLLLLRPFWFDIGAFLQWATGLSIPWVPIILALTILLSILFILKPLPAVYPAAVLVIWIVMTVLLFSELGNESAMILYQYLDYQPYILSGVLLTLLIFVFPSRPFWKKRSVRLAGLLIILAGAVIYNGALESFRFIGQPYLQAPGERSMTIMWMTSGDGLSHVEYGKDFRFTAFPTRDGSRVTGSSMHKVVLTGLEPGERYPYRVVSKEIKNFFPYHTEYGKEIVSDTYEFTTFDREKNKTSFLVINDLHQQNHLWKDIGSSLMEGIDFVVLNGDYFNDLNHPYQIKNHFIKPLSSALGSSVPFIFTRGNHETRGRLASTLKDFTAYPQDSFYFSVSNGPAELVFLDSGEDKDDSHIEYSGLASFSSYREEETRWLSRLAQRDTGRDSLSTIAFSHIPLNGYLTDESPHISYQRHWTELLSAMETKLLLSGHTHDPEVIEESEQQPFPIVIGGGYFSGNSGYAVVRVDVNDSGISVKLTTEKGDIREEIFIGM